MRKFLRLTLERDYDGTGELFAEVVANGFSGRGSAWFNLDQVSDFADALASAFPLDHPIELKGGYWSKETENLLAQVHLALRFYPIGGRGKLGCQVRLATAMQAYDRPEEQHFVQVELDTYYQELQQFSTDLLNLVSGFASEAVLHGSTT